MQSFRLAIVRQHYRPDGGAERIIQRMLAAFGRTLDVSLITQGWQDGSVNELNVMTVPKRGWSRASRFRHFVSDVQSVLQQQAFDLVQSHERIPGVQLYRAGDGVHAEWLRVKADKENFLQHLATVLSLFHRTVLKAERTLFHDPALKMVVCIAQRGKQDILRHYPDVDPDKLVCVCNGIDLAQYSPLPELDRQKMRARLGLAEGMLVAIFVGSGFHRKGLDDLLEALALTTDWHLLVVGKDKKKQKAREKTRKLGIEDRVHFLGIQTQMQNLYSAADLLVHPAWYEPFGNVVLESMAMGRGVLVSSDCGASELIVDGVNGHVFPTGNIQQLTGLLTSCKDQKLLKAMGKAARHTAEQYPISRMVDELLVVYRSLLVKQ